MKNNLDRAKLALSSETLRHLSDAGLARALGGETGQTGKPCVDQLLTKVGLCGNTISDLNTCLTQI
ncbi:MAG TPA: hypothetical protein VG245_05810 [Candidatus Dormibacteraeota bacterium]|jgi:hypothetical protein|nr:hypothetical protein [Candidatus Dormibacteraeota bacterium]